MTSTYKHSWWRSLAASIHYEWSHFLLALGFERLGRRGLAGHGIWLDDRATGAGL
jgi:hypothetical protein